MPLPAGTRIGSYEITGALGAGGMGEVYRARDSRLNRDVAIKVLPEPLAGDADRLTRFTREAQTLAALNHPNIATIYGIEDRAIVMELVDGDDLSGRISQGPLSVPDAIAIARQLIDGLEAAHGIGIVHRDLKPANIKVRDDGTVKVLDFGLAKALVDADGAPDTANSPTLTARATAMGVIIGTAAYMSPEQARGKAIDKRTDVWAFGCVLYEMLTGTKAFGGDDTTEIISNVVKSEPDWNALPAAVPAHLRSILMRCLVKDRKARIPDLSVVRYLLDDAAPSVGAPRRSARGWQAAAALFAATTIAAGVVGYRARSIEPAVASLIVTAPDGMSFTAGFRTSTVAPAISPDGRTVAFTAQDATGKRLLWVRPIDSLAAQPLAGTEGAAYPFWSPDSRFIGYSGFEKLFKVPVGGGIPITLATLDRGITGRGGAWSRDDVIIFNNGPRPLHRVAATGGAVTTIGELVDGESGRAFPSFLPDGRHFLYHANGVTERGGLYVGSLDSGDTTRIVSSNTGAIFDEASGHLLFVRQGTLVAQRFDPTTMALTGEPFPVAERVEFDVVPGLVAFSVSSTGVLAYGMAGAAGAAYQLTWVDRTGKVLGTVGPEAQYRGVDGTQDGSRIASHRHEVDGGDLWVTDVARNTTTRLTFDATQENSSPAWSPDGTRIAFASARDGKTGIYLKSADNTGGERQLFETTTGRAIVPYGWTPDGVSLLFGMLPPNESNDLFMLPVNGERKPVALLQSAFSESQGQISPDGKWLAYASNESGLNEVYVQPLSPDGSKWAISNGGGSHPRWRSDGRELFFIGNGRMRAVEISTKGTALVAGDARTLFDYYVSTINLGHNIHFPYVPSRDGQRLLISAPTSVATGAAAQQPPIVVVINWLDAIRK